MVRLLLTQMDSGISDGILDATGGCFSRALCDAAGRGYVSIVRLLLTSPELADDWRYLLPTSYPCRLCAGELALMALESAASHGHIEVVELLLDAGIRYHCPAGVWPMMVPRDGMALWNAVRGCHEEVVRILLERGGLPPKPKPGRFQTWIVDDARRDALNSGHCRIVAMIDKAIRDLDMREEGAS